MGRPNFTATYRQSPPDIADMPPIDMEEYRQELRALRLFNLQQSLGIPNTLDEAVSNTQDLLAKEAKVDVQETDIPIEGNRTATIPQRTVSESSKPDFKEIEATLK